MTGNDHYDKHVRLVTGAELSALRMQDFAGDGNAVPPALLYLLADAAQVQAALGEGNWPAIDARFAGAASLHAYAAPFALSCFEERRRGATDAHQREFADELIRHFTPTGTQFDHYLARLFADGAAALAGAPDGKAYALGIRTADFGLGAPALPAPRRGFRTHAAIYDADLQRALLDRIYDCFLGYYLRSIERFGERSREDVLAASWGALRHAVGLLLPRLREPALVRQREWVAVAPLRPPSAFRLIDNMLAPSIPLRAHGRRAPSLALRQVLVHSSLPEHAATGLRGLLRAHGLPVRVLVA